MSWDWLTQPGPSQPPLVHKPGPKTSQEEGRGGCVGHAAPDRRYQVGAQGAGGPGPEWEGGVRGRGGSREWSWSRS